MELTEKQKEIVIKVCRKEIESQKETMYHFYPQPIWKGRFDTTYNNAKETKEALEKLIEELESEDEE